MQQALKPILDRGQFDQAEPRIIEVDEQIDVTRRPRVRAFQIGAAATLLAVVVTATVISGGGSSAKTASRRPATTAQEIDSLLAGIPQSGSTLGSSTAPATLQYFVDLQCPTARAFTLKALPSIIRTWVRTGKLRLEYRSLRTVSEPQVFDTQQVAALAAGQQNKLWYYLENFHQQRREHTGYVTDNYLNTLAQQVPHLNLELWADYRHDPLLAAQVTQDEQAAHAAHLHSTPSFLLGRTGRAPARSFGQFATLADINSAVQQILHGQFDHGLPTPPTTAPLDSARSPRRPVKAVPRDERLTSVGPQTHDISNAKQAPMAGR